MQDIVITLVFSIVMLIFMAYPAMVSASFLVEKLNLNQKSHIYLTITLTIFYSLLVGIFLKIF